MLFLSLLIQDSIKKISNLTSPDFKITKLSSSDLLIDKKNYVSEFGNY